VKFWDASAVVPLLVDEAASEAARGLYAADPGVIVWWTTPVECASALARLERDDLVTRAELAESLARLDALRDAWLQVEPGDRLRETALRLLRTHPLRAADALQLAAAVAAADGVPRSLLFVTRDARLALAAQREGFNVLEPA
jgi:predicted nucleic acid-binding protein